MYLSGSLLLKDVARANSGRLATSNMIGRLFSWKEREMASRMATCAWLSLHSSRPSKIISFCEEMDGADWKGLIRRASIWV